MIFDKKLPLILGIITICIFILCWHKRRAFTNINNKKLQLPLIGTSKYISFQKEY